MVWARVLNSVAATFDQAIVDTLIHRQMDSRRRTDAMGHAERINALGVLERLYAPHLEGDSFFPPARDVRPAYRTLRAIGRGEVVDATWPAEYTPIEPSIAHEYTKHVENRFVTARLFLHQSPRDAIILVHGYRAGQFAVEERVWPIEAFYRRGLDVVLAVLPFHGVRAPAGKPRFPSSDPRFSNEGFRQAIGDLRALKRLLEARGAQRVGIMGMSLGGYTTALAATLDPWAFAVPMMPVASFADIAAAGGRFVGSREEQALQHRALERVHRVVSPFERPSRVAKDAALVLGFEGDAITPLAHAEKIARHLDAPLVTSFGGHILQFGRAEAFRAAIRHLGKLGLLKNR